MALTQEQIKELKSQLSQQIQHLPADKKAEAVKQIESLSPEALEEMLNQQKQKGSMTPGKNILRMIVDKDVPSVLADENESAMAVLDINPISPGHIIIIPKSPVTDTKNMPLQAFALAKKLAKRISGRLKVKSTEMQTEKKFGEVIIDLIPIYGENTLSQERKKVSPEELEKIAKMIRPIKKVQVKKIKKPEPSQPGIETLPQRIP